MRQPSNYDNIKLRLKQKTVINEIFGCWIFLGADYGKEQYGKIRFLHTDLAVHRLSAHLYLGLPLDSKALVCHKNECSSRKCWNPDHLYIGDARTNMLDAIEKGTRLAISEIRKRILQNKTKCSKGHDLEQGSCKICREEYMKIYNKEYHENNYVSYKLDK